MENTVHHSNPYITFCLLLHNLGLKNTQITLSWVLTRGLFWCFFYLKLWSNKQNKRQNNPQVGI